MANEPEVLVLHEVPFGGKGHRGSEAIRRVLNDCRQTVVVCGHSHWDSIQPLELDNGTQVLNVDAKVMVNSRLNMLPVVSTFILVADGGNGLSLAQAQTVLMAERRFIGLCGSRTIQPPK